MVTSEVPTLSDLSNEAIWIYLRPAVVVRMTLGASQWLPIVLAALLIIQSELNKLASENVDLETDVG